MGWRVIERPGYFGKSRAEIYERYDKRFGNGMWKIAWKWGRKTIQRPDALLIYQRAYTEFLKSNQEILKWLIEYSDVYDTAPSNVHAGLSYDHQETPNNHIHDVAIRRAVVLDLGLRFKKSKGLLHVRPNQEGERLSPHLIPFHLPEMIFRGKIKYKGKSRDFSANPPWWIKMGIKNNVEQFYQQNKVLQKLI